MINELEAFEWFRKAADKNDNVALKNVARYYRFGIATDKDERKALEYYTKSANQGYSMYAFLTTKNGNSIRRFRTCTFVNLQFPFFSVPIWLGRMFMHSITLIIASIARLFSFSEKKLLKSEIIVVSLLTASKFELYGLAIVKLLISNELSKL